MKGSTTGCTLTLLYVAINLLGHITFKGVYIKISQSVYCSPIKKYEKKSHVTRGFMSVENWQ